MSAYFILNQELSDLQRYLDEYVPAAMSVVGRYGGELLAFDAAAEALEGSPAACVVLARFPDKAAIRAFLADPDYQPAKALRLSISSSVMAVAVPEFQPPG